MRKGLAAIAIVYVGLGVVYTLSDPSGDTGRVTPGGRQYSGVYEVCASERIAPGCRQPDPYLLTWEK